MSTERIEPDLGTIGHIHALRSSGLTWTEIAGITGIPRDICMRIAGGPVWPKLVCRIYPDGTSGLVRVP